jgi:hypothetical protein
MIPQLERRELRSLIERVGLRVVKAEEEEVMSEERLVKALGSRMSFELLLTSRYLRRRGVRELLLVLFLFLICISNVLFYIME